MQPPQAHLQALPVHDEQQEPPRRCGGLEGWRRCLGEVRGWTCQGHAGQAPRRDDLERELRRRRRDANTRVPVAPRAADGRREQRRGIGPARRRRHARTQEAEEIRWQRADGRLRRPAGQAHCRALLPVPLFPGDAAPPHVSAGGGRRNERAAAARGATDGFDHGAQTHGRRQVGQRMPLSGLGRPRDGLVRAGQARAPGPHARVARGHRGGPLDVRRGDGWLARRLPQPLDGADARGLVSHGQGPTGGRQHPSQPRGGQELRLVCSARYAQ